MKIELFHYYVYYFKTKQFTITFVLLYSIQTTQELHLLAKQVGGNCVQSCLLRTCISYIVY